MTSNLISNQAIYEALRKKYEAASSALDDRREMMVGAIRDTRVPIFNRPMLAAPQTEGYAPDVVVGLIAAGQTNDVSATCQLVLSVVAMLFDPATVREAPQRLTPPTTGRGFPQIEQFRRSPTTTLEFPINGTNVNVAPWFLKTSRAELATDEDARGMLAMAIYAAGKPITDKNQAGFFGSADVGGRAKAIKAVTKASDLYITGDRALKQQHLKNINTAFAADPGARYALFSMLNVVIVRGANPIEQAVAGQAALLTSEGTGSFTRAQLAFDTYGEILFMLPNYRREIEMLSRAMERLARQPMLMQNFGYLVDRDSYRTLRVNQFATLAALGGLIVGSEHIENSLSDEKMLAVNALFLKLSELSMARENLAKAEADRQTAAAKAAASG